MDCINAIKNKQFWFWYYEGTIFLLIRKVRHGLVIYSRTKKSWLYFEECIYWDLISKFHIIIFINKYLMLNKKEWRTLLPSFFCQFFNFRIFIRFFIYEVKKPWTFRYRGRICITNINNRDFYAHQGISLKEYIGISIFLIRCCPPRNTQLPFDILFITIHVPCNGSCVSQWGGGGQHRIRKNWNPYIYSFKEMHLWTYNYRLCCVMENTEIWSADTRNKVTFMFA